ncbi:MAG: hypothetical protein ACRDK3_10120 [Actinomycetota bacterium]
MSHHRPAEPTLVDRLLRVAAVAIALAIVALSLRAQAGETGIKASDNVLHGTAYFALTLAVLLAWIGRPGRPARSFYTAVSTTLVIFVGGLAVEVLQSLVGRETVVVEVLANGLGAGLALGLWTVMMRRDLLRS